MSPSATPDSDVARAVAALHHGGVIAYPTEAVWGLGCDPFNETAVDRVLELKHRDRAPGVILIAASWDQVAALIGPTPAPRLAHVRRTWPGPVTWVFPAAAAVPSWIRGAHPGVALRVTAHPTAAALCRAFHGPVVSTSANVSGAPPARTEADVRRLFPDGIDVIVPGPTGELGSPSEIRDALTGAVLRPARG